MAKNGSPQRGSVRIFSFFTGVGTLCSHAAGWKEGRGQLRMDNLQRLRNLVEWEKK